MENIEESYGDEWIIEEILERTFTSRGINSLEIQEAGCRMLQSILNYRLCREVISRINRMDDQSVRSAYSGVISSMNSPSFQNNNQNRTPDRFRGNLHANSSAFSNALFGQIGRNNGQRDNQRYDTSGNMMEECVETVIYDGNTMTETRCAISLEDFTEGDELYRLRACGHFFSKEPLRRWLARRRHCPVCRTSVVQRQTGRPASESLTDLLETSMSVGTSSSGDTTYVFSMDIPLTDMLLSSSTTR